MMDEGEADQLDARACEAEYSAREAMKSLVQAVRDHARTTRRLTEVTAELTAANERLRRVEAFAQNHAITSHACGRSDREWLDLLAIIEGGA